MSISKCDDVSFCDRLSLLTNPENSIDFGFKQIVRNVGGRERVVGVVYKNNGDKLREIMPLHYCPFCGESVANGDVRMFEPVRADGAIK